MHVFDGKTKKCTDQVLGSISVQDWWTGEDTDLMRVALQAVWEDREHEGRQRSEANEWPGW